MKLKGQHCASKFGAEIFGFRFHFWDTVWLWKENAISHEYKGEKITAWIVKHRNWLPRNQGISTRRDFQNSDGKCPEQPDLILQLAPPSVGDWTRWFPEVQSIMNFSILLQFSWCARCWRHFTALASVKNFGVFRWTLSSSDVLFLSVWTMDRRYNLFLDVIRHKITCREDLIVMLKSPYVFWFIALLNVLFVNTFCLKTLERTQMK